MSKKVLIGLLLIGGLIAIHGVDVDAHLAGTLFDPTYRHIASYDCTAHLHEVPNPDATQPGSNARPLPPNSRHSARTRMGLSPSETTFGLPAQSGQPT